ncbi:MAG TPA: hypothetical protein PLK82_08055, partial [Bacteroidales bacterium]|nr:hypothetical protein [Bacteroidales bacterium]
KLIDVAKARALEIASAYSRSDLFQLVTNDFVGRHQRYLSLDDFRKAVEEVQVSPEVRPMEEVMRRQADLSSDYRNTNREAYLISDFQKNSASLDGAHPDPGIGWFLVHLPAEKRDNLYIDSAWFLSPVHQPGQVVNLRVRLHNASGQTLEKIPVKLTINSVQKALASFSVEPESPAEVTLSFTENSSGIQYGVIETVDYPIVYDDKYYFTYTISPSIPVLAINEQNANAYLDALFGHDSAIQLTNSPVKQLDYGKLFSQNLILLNSTAEIPSGLAQEITRFVRNGGSVVVFPPATGKTDSYNALLPQLGLPLLERTDTTLQRIASVNTESPVFTDVFEKNSSGKVVLPDNVDLPVVRKHYILKQETRSQAEVLLKLQNGRPFFVSAPVEKGHAYLLASPADESWTQFPRHVIFVPALYKIALLSNPGRPLCYTTGGNPAIEIPADSVSEANMYKLKKEGSDFEVIPEIKTFGSSVTLLPHDQIREAGLYPIVAGTRTVTGVAFNFDRRESDLKCYSVSELDRQVSRMNLKDIHILKEKKRPLSAEIREIRQGTPLWKWFILLVLFFLACEIALIRLLK